MTSNETSHKAARTRTWRPSAFTWLIVLLALAGLIAGLYPMTASWLSARNQSKIISQSLDLGQVSPLPAEQLDLARKYNQALMAGVKLEAGGNVPVGVGNLSGTELQYEQMLKAND